MVWIVIFLSNYLIFILLLVIPYLWYCKHRLLALKSLLSAAASWLVSSLIKDYFYFPRPYIQDQQSTDIGIWMDGSFPSGHTALAFAVSFMVLTRFRGLGMGMVGLSFLISLSRIVGNVHTVYDVIGGILVSVLSVILTKNVTLPHQIKAFRG